jgi:hypothetical protein
MPNATPSPTATTYGNVLPFDTTLQFVLDDPISSKASKAGQTVRAHLRYDVVVGGRTIVPAGTPVEIRIVNSSAADLADVYGFVDIFFEPLPLPGGRTLPLRAPVARLTPSVTAGHASTVGAEDTVGDIFVPYYPLYQILRKGKNFVLGPGSVIPANTEATLTAAPNGSIAIVTPRPLARSTDPPVSTFPVAPLATPFGPSVEMPHHKATPSPSPSPTPSA